MTSERLGEMFEGEYDSKESTLRFTTSTRYMLFSGDFPSRQVDDNEPESPCRYIKVSKDGHYDIMVNPVEDFANVKYSIKDSFYE